MSKYDPELGPGTIKKINELNTAAEEAVKSANIESLKAAYDNMAQEMLSIHKAFGTMAVLYGESGKGWPLNRTQLFKQ